MTEERLLELLILHSVQVTIVGLVAWGLVRLTARNRPHLAHALWALVLLKCVTPPVVSSPTSVFSLVGMNQVAETTDGLVVHHPHPSKAFILSGWTKIAKMNAPVSVSVPSGPERRFGDVSQARPWAKASVWVGLWGWGVVVSLIIVVVRLVGFRAVIRGQVQPAESELNKLLEELSQIAGLRKKVRLMIVDAPIGPVVVGIWRPMILIPRLLVQEGSPEPLKPLLTHELLHVRRGDLRWAALQIFATSMCWFHPLVWLASRWLTQESERSCDEETVATLGCTGASYARALLDVLDRKQQLRVAPTLPGVRPVEITADRLERVMKLEQGSLRRSPWWVAWVLVVGGLITLPGAAWVAAQEGTEAEKIESSQGPREDSATEINDKEANGKEAIEEDDVVLIELKRVRLSSDLVEGLKLDWQTIDDAKTLRGVSPIQASRLVENSTEETTGASERPAPSPSAQGNDAADEPEEDKAEKGKAGGDHWINFVPAEHDAEAFSHLVVSNETMSGLLEKLKSDESADVLMAPRMMVFDGQEASIESGAQRPFLVSYATNQDGDSTPVIRHINEGFVIKAKPVIDHQAGAIDLNLSAETTAVVSADLFTFEAKEAPSAGKGGLSVEGQDVDETQGSDSGRIPEFFKVQIPNVQRERVALCESVPDGHCLIIRMPSSDTSDDDGGETLTLITMTKGTQPRISPEEMARLEAEGLEIIAKAKKNRPVYTDCGVRFSKEQLRRTMESLQEQHFDDYRVDGNHLRVQIQDVLFVQSVAAAVLDADVIDFVEITTGDRDDTFNPLVIEAALSAMEVPVKIHGKVDYEINPQEIKLEARQVQLRYGPQYQVTADRMAVKIQQASSQVVLQFNGNVRATVDVLSLSADFVQMEDDKLLLKGGVRLHAPEQTLTAEQVDFLLDETGVQILGKAKITSLQGQVIDGDSLHWDFQTSEFSSAVAEDHPAVDVDLSQFNAMLK